MRSVPANIGLVLAGTARDVMVAALAKAGHEVHIAATLPRVRALVARGTVDAWIFDARSDEVLELLLTTDGFLLPADNIPGAADINSYTHWVEGLMTQLDIALSDTVKQGSGRTADRWREVRGVWLLAGSAGATGAIQEFLNAFRQPPPAAFLYAQHLDLDQQRLLQRFTVPDERFSLCLSDGVHTLEPGRLVMISPRRKIALNAFGQLSMTREAWSGPHTPDINELLVILSAARLPAVGVIIFSGMGNDGAAALHLLDAVGGRIWVQTPESAVCPAMPQAALDTGLVQKSGAPAQLAAALEALYRP